MKGMDEPVLLLVRMSPQLLREYNAVREELGKPPLEAPDGLVDMLTVVRDHYNLHARQVGRPLLPDPPEERELPPSSS
jgi:hypothetical protein